MSTWPSNWNSRTIGSFADARGGTGFPIALQGREAGQLPFYKVSDMNIDGNTVWMRRANNYISEAELRELGGRPFDAKTIVFPKVGATIYTNKKRILASKAVVDNNVMGVTVTDRGACLAEFLFFWFQGIALAKLSSPGTVPSITSTRVKAQEVMLPPLEEQRQIAAVLSAVQRLIERHEQLIALTAELKKALVHRFFTVGTRREPLKQTEIGLIPMSWEVVKLAELLKPTESVDVRREGNRHIKYIDVSGISREFLRIESSTTYRLKDAPGRARKKIDEGDVLFATVRPTLLRVARVPKEFAGQICSTAFCVLRDANEKTAGRFLYYVVQREPFLRRLAAIESGASYPAVTDRQLKAQQIPRPTEAEQMEIAQALEACDAKLRFAADKEKALTALFRTLLRDLLTARVRVNDLDVTSLGEVTEDCAGA